MVLENVGPTFREAERLLTEYFAEGGYMPHERRAVLNTLRTLKTSTHQTALSIRGRAWVVADAGVPRSSRVSIVG